MTTRNEIASYTKEEVVRQNEAGLFRVPLVGFSSPKDALYRDIKKYAGEQHVYPEEILPEVETVISFFIPLSMRVVESNCGRGAVSELYAQSYISCNRLINHISAQLVEQFRMQGYKAEMVRSTHTYDPKILKAAWSHRSAAYIAGMGTFGLNNLLITPKGCAGRFGTVFLSAALEPDERRAEERCRYYIDGSCRACVASCPTQALAEQGFDRFQCHSELMRTRARFMHLGTCDVCGKCLVGPCAILAE